MHELTMALGRMGGAGLWAKKSKVWGAEEQLPEKRLETQVLACGGQVSDQPWSGLLGEGV